MPDRKQRVGAYAFCERDSSDFLLCRMSAKTRTPGTWTLPGGGVLHAEDPAQAVLRELAEETGLTSRVEQLVGLHSNVYESGTTSIHGIRLIYRVRVTGGKLRSESDDTTDHVRWVPCDTLPAITLSDHARVALQLATRETDLL